jgi:hypothetical protein
LILIFRMFQVHKKFAACGSAYRGHWYCLAINSECSSKQPSSSQLKEPSNTLATQRDIVENPKHLKIRELEGAVLVRSVIQVDLAFVFAN